MMTILASACSSGSPPGPPAAPGTGRHAPPREERIRIGTAEIFYRETGQGQPIIVLHGGPDFDHTYLLPDMDRLSDAYRLIYYDQRGRGRSAEGVRPEDVTLESEMADLDAVREHAGSGSVALLGHSWGAVLALEYAIRHPDRVSHLILMNPAPASREDFLLYRNDRREKGAEDLEKMKVLRSTAGYKEGDPDAVEAYYRVHFKPALARPEDYEKVIASLRASFTPEGILKARAVEARLLEETWLSSRYDLLPALEKLSLPTLVLYGDHDFIPAGCAEHIARSIPNARLVTFEDCGHFTYLECPDLVRREIDDLFRMTAASR